MECFKISLFLAVLCVALCVASADYLNDPDLGNIGPNTCIEALDACKHNSTCRKVYKSVKENCKRGIGSECLAAANRLQQCAMDIEYLRRTFFSVENKCECFNRVHSTKKLLRCVDIFNRIHANPCFDRGESARKEAIKIASVTMRAAVAMKVDDVTQTYIDVIEDVPFMPTTTVAPENDWTPTEEPLDDVIDDVIENAKMEEMPSEREMADIDSLFAEETFMESSFLRDQLYDGPERPQFDDVLPRDVIDQSESLISEEGEEIDEIVNEKIENFKIEEDIDGSGDESDFFVDDENEDDEGDYDAAGVTRIAETEAPFEEPEIDAATDTRIAETEIPSEKSKTDAAGVTRNAEMVTPVFEQSETDNTDGGDVDLELKGNMAIPLGITKQKNTNGNSVLDIVLMTCGVIIGVFVVAGAGYLMYQRRRKIKYTSGKIEEPAKHSPFKMRHPTIVIRSWKKNETCLKGKEIFRHHSNA